MRQMFKEWTLLLVIATAVILFLLTYNGVINGDREF